MKKYAILATLMLLVIGLGSFQYWAIGSQDTASATIGNVADELSIDAGAPDLFSGTKVGIWRPFNLSNTSQYLYKIVFDTTYAGNYTATIYLANADDLAKDYTYMFMNVSLCNNASQVQDSRWLSLTNGRVDLLINASTGKYPGGTAYINITDGAAKLLPWWRLGAKSSAPTSPKFVIDVEEIGY